MIRIETETEAACGASATLAQRVFRGSTPLFRARVKFACMMIEGRPARLPPDTRAALAELGGDET